MEQEIKEMNDVVRDVQTTNRKILVQLNNIQALDSHVCTCPCHISDANVTTELREQKSRIDALEKLVQTLLTRDSHDISANDCVSSEFNVTDEYKCQHDVKDDRNRGAAVGLVRKTNVDQGHATSPQTSSPRVDKAQSDVPKGKTGWQKSIERAERINVAQKGRETKDIQQPPLKEGGRATQDTQQAECVKSSISPKSEQPRIPSTADLVGSIRERNKSSRGDATAGGGHGGSTGHLADGGATASTKTEDGDLDVEVKHQEETRYFSKSTDWSSVAQMELDSGKATAINSLGGAHTAICLDISESMATGNAWRQAKKFLLEYIDGLLQVSREHKVSDEHVSFVTFGHETRVVKRMTNNYVELRRAVESVKLGGPSPMYGGLYMALVSLIHSEHWTTTVNDMTVYSKIILISDGIVTDTRQQAGPDLMESKEEYTKDLVDPLREILRRGIDVYCVPVGNANMNTMESLAADEGRLWRCEDGEKLARRYFLTKAAGPGIVKGLFGPSFNPNFKSEVKLSDSDRLYMLEIVNEANRRRWDDISRARELEDVYFEKDSDRLLAVGSRVRRGVDWEHGDVDADGPGTVVGHHRHNDKLFVLWDCDNLIYPYRYGENNCYDVLPADDVRQLKPDGSLAVGCLVKPNARTNDKSPDIQAFDRGVVVRLVESFEFTVKWNSGKNGTHLYHPGVIQEVDFCAPTESAAPVVQKENPGRKQSRPKNKNIK